jgi:hypothetical protein
MNIASLDLSDSQTHNPSTRSASNPSSALRSVRARNGRVPSRAALNRVAGQKRKIMNLADIFDLGSLGDGKEKDVFGNGAKRSRHT